MCKLDAEKITTEYLKPIYGFALKRCGTLEDAEDLAQEIVLRVYRTLLVREDIRDVPKFIWTVAHNALSNYYRDERRGIGTPLEDLAEVLGDGKPDLWETLSVWEDQLRLRQEIAYLSRVQRRCVIAYYYEKKSQSAIARELELPVGTVKWHLFEAKKELKRGMEQMREHSELQFNPVRFAGVGTCGSIGSRGDNQNFFHSALSQNIVYTVRSTPKTVNQIADALGVSPVYVESEAEYLEEYGFLIRCGKGYLSNILIEEPSAELLAVQREMYRKAAKVVANDLYDALQASGLLQDKHIRHGYDENFLLWTLIPYLAACPEPEEHEGIPFDRVATLRPDGGHNLCTAHVLPAGEKVPGQEARKEKWWQLCWNADQHLLLWQMDSPWSGPRMGEDYQITARQDMVLLRRWAEEETLHKEELAYLVRQGYFRMAEGDAPVCQCVWVEGDEAHSRLMALGDCVKARCRETLNEIKKPYVQAVLADTPKHLQKMQQYALQSVFGADSWFLQHCLRELQENGKLRLPSDVQKKAMTVMVVRK